MGDEVTTCRAGHKNKRDAARLAVTTWILYKITGIECIQLMAKHMLWLKLVSFRVLLQLMLMLLLRMWMRVTSAWISLWIHSSNRRA